VLLFSCGKNKSVQLPEIESSLISEILDVSPAYIFYDETKKDSVELNRNNLIISTNWLFNIDKRLTLKQIMPSLLFLQNKKRNAKMHKNEAAKNYFTCHNTAITNLGFIEFTNTIYDTLKTSKFGIKQNNNTALLYFEKNKIKLNNISFNTIKNAFKSIENDSTQITLAFNKTLTFQDYITYKWHVEKFKAKNTQIDNTEFIIEN
jgi:hypothetical protein